MPVPPEFDALVLRCLEKPPERRFPDVMRLLESLKHAVRRHRGAPGSTSDTEVMALGLHLRIDIEAENKDDSLAGDLGTLLDLAEERLRVAGFMLASSTENEIFAAKPIPTELDAMDRARQEAAGLSMSLYEELCRRPSPDDRIPLTLCMHVDEAVLRKDSGRRDGQDLVGGALMHPSVWAPQGPSSGLLSTGTAEANLSGFVVTPGPGNLVILSRSADGA